MATSAETPKIIVHHLENSRSHRVLMLLEELGLPCEIKSYKRDPETHLAPPELKAIHPLGKSPVVTIEQGGKTLTLAESGLVIEYLISKYGPQLAPSPEDDESYAKYLYWLHFAEGTFMPVRFTGLVFKMTALKVPFYIRPIANSIAAGVDRAFLAPRTKTMFEFMESELKAAGGQYFAGGKLTGADLILTYPLEASLPDLGPYPTLKAYILRIKELPSYKAAAAKGGDLDFSAFTK